LSYYRQVLEHDPYYFEARSNLGAVLLEDEQVDEAEQVLNALIEEAPQYGEAYKNLGRCLIFREDFVRTEAAFKMVRENGALQHEIELGLAHLMFERSRYDEAFAHSKRALEFKPEHAPSYLQLGLVLSKLERSEASF
jgi:tetratricopeptide (TPR) repeat protein